MTDCSTRFKNAKRKKNIEKQSNTQKEHSEVCHMNQYNYFNNSYGFAFFKLFTNLFFLIFDKNNFWLIDQNMNQGYPCREYSLIFTKHTIFFLT